jgi:hypothetical protein
VKAAAQLCVAALLGASGMALIRCAPEPELDPDASAGPGPIILEADPAVGETDVPVDKVIKLYVSDHLDGESVRRSSFSLTSGSIGMWLMTFYDPVRGRLVVWPSSHMREGAVWVMEVLEGLTGLDGAPVQPVTATWFTTGEEAGDDHPYDDRTYEGDVAGIFDARCASCHGGPSGGMAGLALDGVDGIVGTALNAGADGWAGWKRVRPFEPGSSYLLYKVIGDPRISGEPMPRSLEAGGQVTPLSQEQQEILSDWIAGGAVFFDLDDQEK